MMGIDVLHCGMFVFMLCNIKIKMKGIVLSETKSVNTSG